MKSKNEISADLFVGCLISPTWSTEREMALEEFIQKLEDGQPWTREKAETQLGVKLVKSSSTGVVTRWYNDPGLFVYGEGLIVNAVSYAVWVKTNEMRSMRIGLDDKSSCFTQEKIKKSYPGGEFTDLNIHPGGSDDYRIDRGWGGDVQIWRSKTMEVPDGNFNKY
jgi:hypothetical protein